VSLIYLGARGNLPAPTPRGDNKWEEVVEKIATRRKDEKKSTNPMLFFSQVLFSTIPKTNPRAFRIVRSSFYMGKYELCTNSSILQKNANIIRQIFSLGQKFLYYLLRSQEACRLIYYVA